MEAKSVDADFIFRIFTVCQHDIPTIVIDVRPHKEFKHNHIAGAFCVRLSSNGQVLADYSASSYNIKWAQDCWWGRNVLVYGEEGLKKDHPVVRFLSTQGKCRALHYYKDGYGAFERRYPSLCTPSVKAASIKRYPSQIIPGFLYLGDWDSATDFERLEELNIRRILTIHNHPERLRPPANIRHLRQQLPDVEDANISELFSQAYDFMDEGRERGQAQRAKDLVSERRSVVALNDGFWLTLCALEPSLGIAERSDPTATAGFRGADAPEPQQLKVQLSKDAAGGKVPVRMLTTREVREETGATGGGGDGGTAAAGVKRRGEGGPEGEEANGGGGGGGVKRSRLDGGEGTMPASSLDGGGGGGGFRLSFAVRKPEGLMGRLDVGPMRPTQRLVLGRSTDCDVVLEHPSISRHHAALSVDRTGAVFVTDLQSGHGTKVADVWIKPNAPRQLQTGQAMGFGASTRSYKLLSVAKA
ncbi:MAP kinase phosphatase 5 [Volvox carteri f. nagariensis]|uniref:MAP kinase phosphatase 5 n=1 Tax=Volvox carteri f. nagariensis TaxID=3068 RepID=D8U6K5_VOLCA|nr:MAP kinase phosphatase 5 [Volvox carteri f. nagariensis]EFJ44730.1 MAP kinase phosphatase 5 [Volvox carteri f. nagariensis]|eukprot:XP_002954306.1 MAP kinase phosphatase 5 [Volvox carteri f. nagariensis]